MKIIRTGESSAEMLAPLVADFRVTLRSYKGIASKPDIEEGKEEVLEFLSSGDPVFAVEEKGDLIGYLVCRVEEPCLWVEQLYVKREYRRKGVASLLFEKAEELSKKLGEDTVFNYVHPNNDGMIQFLRSKGYTVLNLIEIRKPYRGEKLTTKIQVDHNTFDY